MNDNEDFKIINGNSLEVLDTMNASSIDCIVTDPPYELGFMGKSWDSTGIAYNVELWKKALRVLKPGGHLLAFGGTRTYHRIACAIEDAGFEIRDCIMWLYGSGFPKSMNIGLAIDKKNGVDNRTGNLKSDGNGGGGVDCFSDDNYEWKRTYEERKATNEWGGWGTQLKPAYEPIIVARKICKGSVTDNVLKYGVGGINIDECRVETTEKIETGRNGRFPANVILTYDETDEKEVCGGMPNTKGDSRETKPTYDKSIWGNAESVESSCLYNDEGSASRYFYCAKASSKDRDEGLDLIIDNDKNIHPTVKPVELMQYLVRLVAPRGATVLDIFNGSGSTGKAVAFENRERNVGYKYIGIELEPSYCEISKARIEYALHKYKYDVLEEVKENEKKGQLSLFDFCGEDNEKD